MKAFTFLILITKAGYGTTMKRNRGMTARRRKRREKKPAGQSSPKTKNVLWKKGTGDSLKESKVNGDDHHEEDMDMSD